MILNKNFEFNDLYRRLNIFALTCIKGKSNMIKEDIVHSAYLTLISMKLDFTFENMRQFIYDEIRSQSISFSLSSSIDNAVNTSSIENIFKGIETKTCTCCKQSYPVTNFHKGRVLPNGVIMYQSSCKECQKETNKRNRDKKRTDAEYNKYFTEKAKSYREKRRSLIFGNERIHTHFKEVWKMETRERRSKEKNVA